MNGLVPARHHLSSFILRLDSTFLHLTRNFLRLWGRKGPKTVTFCFEVAEFVKSYPEGVKNDFALLTEKLEVFL